MIKTDTPTVEIPNPPLLLEEAAAALRMSVTTLRELRNKGKGPKARMIAGKLLFRVNDLDQWLEQQPES
ncbi:helix-turn-helix domain-containing protein [Paenarthrobacter sp. A20]|uniref:helix-turn-helix domain-containing protein n=1 Tax=Paenarthrobacter sp. A20 TaxID=2817891 RepID=UPI00209F034E|nr:helix-turn-helix domain-containing protein [Paenarthrobacter sp. A20]MCP1414361.1 putative DNA-binding transcriptional regulator AlpA [Paenarthrobacter sp. A20]